MSTLIQSPWRIASMAVVLGLLGSCAAVLSLADAPASSTKARGSGSATLRSAGDSLRSLRPVSAAALGRRRAGVKLMSQAAAACDAVTYGGVQIVLWWGQAGASATVVQVWHRPGSGTLAQASASGSAVLSGPAQQSGPGQAADQGAILEVSGSLLALMQANYQIAYAGRGLVDNRQAEVVEVRRPDGSLAAKYWLDAATKLPLRREIFASGTHMISEDAFIDLQIGEHGLGAKPVAQAEPWGGQLDAAGLTALRAQGWPLPAVLPGNLALFRASKMSAKSGDVLDLSYSDGLSVVSLFLQRGQLPRAMPGWQRVAMRGHSIFSNDPDNRSLTWSAGGFVYTVIADAPPATISEVVTWLPHASQPGFWERLGRGFRRLASWANPFG